MKKTKILPVVLIAFLASFCFLSCDLLITYWQRTTTQDVLIKFIYHNQHQGWKDEVLVSKNGEIRYRRLEGDTMPSSTRMLADDEFRYVKNLFENFYSLNSEYIEYDESTTTLYTITYHGEEGKKTVRCDNSVYVYWGKLSLVVNTLVDFRASLIGEKRFAGKLSFDLQPEKTTVPLGEPVEFRYQVTNTTDKEVIMHFGNLQQMGYKIYHDGELLFEFPQAFLPATSRWEIPPLSTEVQTMEWEQIMVDESGDRYIAVESGTYTVVQYLLDSNSPYRAHEVTIKEND